jgi:hypothetical protein
MDISWVIRHGIIAMYFFVHNSTYTQEKRHQETQVYVEAATTLHYAISILL